jgi:Tol biopolymer transport system component
MFDRWDMFIMPASEVNFAGLGTPVGYKYQPSFSPNGKWIAYQDGRGV